MRPPVPRSTLAARLRPATVVSRAGRGHARRRRVPGRRRGGTGRFRLAGDRKRGRRGDAVPDIPRWRAQPPMHTCGAVKLRASPWCGATAARWPSFPTVLVNQFGLHSRPLSRRAADPVWRRALRTGNGETLPRRPRGRRLPIRPRRMQCTLRKVRADARIAPLLKEKATPSNADEAPFLDIGARIRRRRRRASQAAAQPAQTARSRRATARRSPRPRRARSSARRAGAEAPLARGAPIAEQRDR